ncbi:anti-sigma factor [Paraburkholderia sp. Tr-20389]|uniref:anti-sigma factor family protein n=1 Tax=Paraburkholderia sp. Tr-20389 TaxID=2703903 RepID=UPI001980BAF0|nr:anti-sigma factor [Paraburkholderia sp. Tr-20389]MBN3751550.1 anti-sigma factor [Paraburkholderia sp. Tr-20389]
MIDDAQLLAYVDGELPPEEREAVEARLGQSADARAKVELLRASRVDYAAAFASQPLPPVPDSLRLGVDALIRAHGAVPQHARDQPTDVRRGVPLWLAAACVAGAFTCGMLMRQGMPGAGDAQTAANPDVAPWVTAAAGYQKLFTRETVAYVKNDAATLRKIVSDIRQQDHLPLRIPDLSSAGLTFKAMQRLRFNDKPLLQIVYLPESGPPVTLCVMKDARPDHPVAVHTVDTLDVAMWRQAELGYALIGKPEGVNLVELGKRISTFDVRPLFTDAGPEQPVAD